MSVRKPSIPAHDSAGSASMRDRASRDFRQTGLQPVTISSFGRTCKYTHRPPANRQTFTELSFPMRNLFNCLIPITLVALTGCAAFRAPSRASAPEPLPSAFTAVGTEKPAVSRWWETFDSAELNALIAESLQDNLSLAQSWARLEQARAVARQTGAGLYPTLDAEASAARGRSRNDGVTRTAGSYALGLVASYEVGPLWAGAFAGPRRRTGYAGHSRGRGDHRHDPRRHGGRNLA